MGLFDQQTRFAASEYTAICEGLVATYWRKTGTPPVLCTDSQHQTWVEAGRKLNSNATMPSKEEFDRACNEWSRRTGIEPEKALITTDGANILITRRAWSTRAERDEKEGAQVLAGVIGIIMQPAAFMADVLYADGWELTEQAKQVGLERLASTIGPTYPTRQETDEDLRARIVDKMRTLHPEVFNTDGEPIDPDDEATAGKQAHEESNILPVRELPPRLPNKDDVKKTVDGADSAFASLRNRFGS